MKKILVPTDFSKCADNAMNYALELAKISGASIQAIHVVFPNQGVENNVYNAFWIDDYLDARRKAFDSWMRRFRRKMKGTPIEIKGTCEVGFPVPLVCEAAKEIGADLIVMGTTGATGLKGALIGSTASGVTAKTNIPVLIVPTKGSIQPGSNIVLATDFRMNLDDRSLLALKQWHLLNGGTIKVVHVLSDTDSKPDKSQENKVSHRLAGIKHDFHYLHDTDVPQAISDFIEATDATGLITISHKHSLLFKIFNASVSRELANQANVPMLVLHDV